MLDIGTYRHLMQCSGPRRTFSVLAIDHRANLIESLQKHRDAPVTDEEVIAFKNSAARYLADVATAMLTDPDYGLPGLASGVIPGSVGLMAPLEVTHYDVPINQRQVTFIPDWDVHKLKRAGYSGAKLLIYYHPEAADAAEKTAIVDAIIEQCQAEQVPFFLEPIAYSLDPERPLSNEERRQVVIEAARHFSRRGVDVLKMEFPVDVRQEPDENVWREALADLDAACSVPWTLLSAGVQFDTFLRQAALACMAGASGVIAGRAVWAEATALHGEAREQFLATTARERMVRLTAVCEGLGRPWTERHTPPDIHQRWYA